MKIYTITLNPAYDVHAYAEQFAPFHENLACVTSREAGGKGVNLSRALQNGGTENTAVIVLGKDNCAEFKVELEAAGLQTILLEKPGRIRENLTLHCAEQPETRISFSGFAVDDSLLNEVAALLDVDTDTVLNALTVQVKVGLINIIARSTAHLGAYWICRIEGPDLNLSFFDEHLYASIIETCDIVESKHVGGCTLDNKPTILNS